jgi:hypothetical protein
LSDEQVEGPTVQVLGVYRVPATPELYAEAMELKYGGLELTPEEQAAAESSIRTEIGDVVLVEVAVANRDATFDVSDFSQPGSVQAPYDEVYLDATGTAVIAQAVDPPNVESLRVAFFLHFFDETKPLMTSYGNVSLPVPKEMPERLRAIIKYKPVD